MDVFSLIVVCSSPLAVHREGICSLPACLLMHERVSVYPRKKKKKKEKCFTRGNLLYNIRLTLSLKLHCMCVCVHVHVSAHWTEGIKKIKEQELRLKKGKINSVEGQPLIKKRKVYVTNNLTCTSSCTVQRSIPVTLIRMENVSKLRIFMKILSLFWVSPPKDY